MLSAYGAHRWYLLWLYRRHRADRATPLQRFKRLPHLTVQLPIYNEMYVAGRLIDAVCALDYPKDRLEIQVLDDSTDETREIVAAKTTECAARGFDIAHLHRTNRSGFKAGALEAGLQVAKGDFIAILTPISYRNPTSCTSSYTTSATSAWAWCRHVGAISIPTTRH